MSPQQQRRNGNGTASGSDERRGPRNDLELKTEILRRADGNDLFQNVNLGQGNYEDDDFWQQIRSYRRGLYMFIAFSEILTQQAVHETKVKLAREGIAHYDERTNEVIQEPPMSDDEIADDQSSWEAELEKGEEMWQDLGDPRQPITEKQGAAILKKANVDMQWLPVSWQMMIGRHEASRSKDAELLRDVLADVKQLTDKSDGPSSSSLLGGRSA